MWLCYVSIFFLWMKVGYYKCTIFLVYHGITWDFLRVMVMRIFCRDFLEQSRIKWWSFLISFLLHLLDVFLLNDTRIFRNIIDNDKAHTCIGKKVEIKSQICVDYHAIFCSSVIHVLIKIVFHTHMQAQYIAFEIEQKIMMKLYH